MTKLKHAEVKTVRSELLARQAGRCAVCQRVLSAEAAVLDHDHRTGAVRGVLHRGCNSLLGKLENNAARYGVTDIAAFANGVAPYLRTHGINVTGYIHPTFATTEEKRLKRNKKARIARAKAKANG